MLQLFRMDELQLLLATDKEFSDMSKEKGAAEAFAAYVTEDAIMLPNNGNPLTGIAAIYKSMSLGKNESLVWDPQGGKVSESSDMGYTWGIYTLSLETGKSVTGKYLNVWVKQNGTWKVEVDMGNNNPTA